MSNPTKVPIDEAFKNRLRSRGFCVDDPERRIPTHNDFPSKVMDLQSRVSLGRATKLILSRAVSQRSDRVRVVPWTLPFIGCAARPNRAAAHDHHQDVFAQSHEAPDTIRIAIDNAVEWLSRIDFGDPMFTTAILGGLLMTQTAAIFQRRAYSKSVASKFQSDLFPEMIEDGRRENKCAIWEVDAATRQGQVRTENQDALNILSFDYRTQVIIVCDGAGGVGGGREASHSATGAVATLLQDIWNERGELIATDLESAISAARKTAVDLSLEGVTTALLVLLLDDQMHYATLGDGAVSVVWPDGMVGHVQVPHHTLGRPSNEIGAYIGGDCEAPARTGTVRLEPGSIVLAMTDGASDLFNFEDFAGERKKITELKGLSDVLLAQLEAASDPETGAWLHSDNMTLAMARLNLGAGR